MLVRDFLPGTDRLLCVRNVPWEAGWRLIGPVLSQPAFDNARCGKVIHQNLNVCFCGNIGNLQQPLIPVVSYLIITPINDKKKYLNSPIVSKLFPKLR